jgi:hypothetical protein
MESPQYQPRAAFRGETFEEIEELATQYLRNFKNLNRGKNQFVPSTWYKDATFRKNEFRFSDDGVVSSWVLEEVPCYDDPKDFPPQKTVIITGGVSKTYTENPDGSVKVEITER